MLLAVVHTWPLATAPGRLSRNDTATRCITNGFSRGMRTSSRSDPRHLFDANIFYPERHTLAFSDHLIVQGVIGAPLFWLGASPVLAYNLLLIAGLALTGVDGKRRRGAMDGEWCAGVVSGSLMAFNAIR